MATRIKMYLWVTSACNMKCPLCNQQHALAKNRGYAMDLDELKAFIKSTQDRGFHYYILELTGGEVTLWRHFEEGIKLIYDAKICDKITLATNGNNPERVMHMASMLDYWIVSRTQATLEQVAMYKDFYSKICFNVTKHREAPKKPFTKLLPAVCCCTMDRYKVEYRSVMYIKGKMYYCHFAEALSEWVDLAKDDAICSFDDDFIAKFSGKTFDREICTYCLCNKRIWEAMPV